MTNPSVIVATEHENTVRLYVGAPSNGGMAQVGQLSVNRAIDPHDLADMAVSMSVSFGWLETPALPDIPKLHANVAPAVVALPAAAKVLGGSQRPHYQVQVPCPVIGCDHVTRRKNLATHLMTQQHSWSRDEANRAAREAKPIDAPESDKRVNSASRRKQAGKQVRVGKSGAIYLRDVLFPAVLKFIGDHGEVTTADLAKKFDETTSTTGSWLRTMARDSQVVCTNPDVGPGIPMRWTLAQT